MTMKKDQIKTVILTLAGNVDKFQVSDIKKVLRMPVSRQFISVVLKGLVDSKVLITAGSRRYTYYSLPQNIDSLINKESRVFLNVNLQEHLIYDDFISPSAISRKLNENAASIVHFAFSEMLNNAIEHSRSKKIKVELYQESHSLVFVIRDYGVGVFENIKAKMHLKSDLEAIQELLKGKTTTAPRAHSGEGIFFTSKAVDEFVMESSKTVLRVNNIINDVFVERGVRLLRGTKITIINQNTGRHLSDVFRQFYSDPQSLAFDKTLIHIKLFTMGTIYISRSQARRVVSKIEKKFKVVILDFDKVPTIGQAFADEVFRVFANEFPNVSIRYINANENVEFMITRAINTATMAE